MPGSVSLRSLKPSRQWKFDWGLAVVACIAVFFVATIVVRRADNRYPKTWDVRVEPLARQVEQIRGLQFKHPVTMNFLPEAEFVALVSSNRRRLRDPDAETMQEGLLRARGMAGPSVDQAESDEGVSATMLGYYDDDKKVMWVRGTTTTPIVRLTIVHELTHALQDQHFKLNKMWNGVTNDAGSFAVRALIEGDAEWVEDEYFESLSSADKDELRRSGRVLSDSGAYDKIPPGVLASLGAPYQLGSLMVGSVRAQGGSKALDKLFRRPPLSEEQIVFPLIEHSIKGSPLRAPIAGADVVDGPSTYGYLATGPLSTFLQLAGRLDSRTAWQAASGWSAESIVVTEVDDKICVISHVRGRYPADTQRLNDAYQGWLAAAPNGVGSVQSIDDFILVRSCDVGADTPEPRPTLVEDLNVLTTVEAWIGDGLLVEGKPSARVGCTFAGVHERLDLPALGVESVFDNSGLSDEVENAAAAAAKDCWG